MSNTVIAIVVALIATPWSILGYFLLRNRRNQQPQMSTAPVYVPPAAAPVHQVTEPVRYQASPVVQKKRPRRKLFLSWAAVDRALRSGDVSEEDLSSCLFCTSEAENGLAQEYNAKRYEELLPHFQTAGKEGRLICPRGTRYYNRTTLAEVNRMLEHNGLSRLFVADTSSTLEQIPMYSCVPRVERDEEIETMWAAHPYRGNWKSCWGAHTDDSAPVDEGDDNAATDEPYSRPNWMDEMNKPIFDAYRARHPEDFMPKKPAANSGNAGDEAGESDEPWRKSLRPDNDAEGNEAWRESLRSEEGDGVEDNEAWRESLRPDTEEERNS
ncbi:MAG: hypothetical protein K2W95_31890 [Candidatus Obscuribacterales bacterium]|nr:hypothetical protein [Candidatus Obscuribacterales bacterium]